ncbi:MAG TPA: cyclopropane-fatty-acyl-phospholipid synthase family protein [Burkholderiaceae bacterium]|nr:cyclopropane-fatty-acyl-phospholipid synthase family protein [Burkholderiaceae bacterium]
MESLGERLLRSRLERLRHGQLTVVHGDSTRHYGRPDDRCPFRATLQVRDPRFFAEAAFGGSVGAGESFMAGDWAADDLTATMRILLANRDVLDGLDSGGLTRLSELARRGLHATARNTRAGSRRNIAAHYDLGNDFFERLLDPSMMYSCAFYASPGVSLEAAQVAKLDRVCRKLDLRPSDHLLEIGTGWGGLALHAARHFGCRVTTTTISGEQHALARQRIEAAGLADRVTLLLDDYRDLSGKFDKLVSIEMIEAVGHQYFDAFFSQCGRLLVPGGTMLLQGITIDDGQYKSARDSVDFIKRHIFPGCCIPSMAALTMSATRAAPLRVIDLEDIGPHYATTLAAWRANLHAHADELRGRGYGDVLQRMFEFYLCYCEAGFAERALGNVQMLLQETSRPAVLPPRV